MNMEESDEFLFGGQLQDTYPECGEYSEPIGEMNWSVEYDLEDSHVTFYMPRGNTMTDIERELGEIDIDADEIAEELEQGPDYPTDDDDDDGASGPVSIPS